MGNKRKAHILDVMCNRFYFGEAKEEVLGQRSWQAAYLSTLNKGSIFLSSSEKKQKKQKTSSEVEEMPCEYSPEVSKFVLKNQEKSKVIASVIP